MKVSMLVSLLNTPIAVNGINDILCESNKVIVNNSSLTAKTHKQKQDLDYNLKILNLFLLYLECSFPVNIEIYDKCHPVLNLPPITEMLLSS